MAIFVFENTDQGEAATFTADDFLVFSNANANARSVVVAPSAGDQLTNNGITITSGGLTLTFAATEIAGASQAGQIVFNDNSLLRLGTSNADTENFGTSTADNVIYGFGGADTLTGGDGNDYLYGGTNTTGVDSLVGGAGNDHLYGNALTTAQGSTDGTDNLAGGAGNDYLQGNAGVDTLDGGDGNDRIFGGAGNDIITGGTGTGSDTVNGNTGNDQIDGGAGNDVLRGGQGTDTILGGADNDILYGDLGDDTLTGGAGLDVLFGGDGIDTFTFGTGDASTANIGTTTALANVTDIIADYADGTDKIALGFTVTAVSLDTQGTTFATLQAAQTYAQQLLDNSAATTGQVAALRLGSDTYLFFNGATGADAITSVVKLAAVSDPTVISLTGGGASDFV